MMMTKMLERLRERDNISYTCISICRCVYFTLLKSSVISSSFLYLYKRLKLSLLYIPYLDCRRKENGYYRRYLIDDKHI